MDLFDYRRVTVVELGHPEIDLFCRYPLKGHLLFKVVLYPAHQPHEIVLSGLVVHKSVVPRMIALDELVPDRVVTPFVHIFDGF